MHGSAGSRMDAASFTACACGSIASNGSSRYCQFAAAVGDIDAPAIGGHRISADLAAMHDCRTAGTYIDTASACSRISGDPPAVQIQTAAYTDSDPSPICTGTFSSCNCPCHSL